MRAAGQVERWTVVGFREAVFQVAPGEPVRAAGCCERCGQCIRYVVTVRSSLDGRTMGVGQDCAATLEGGPELAAIRAAERAYFAELERPEREARELAESIARDERRAAAARRNAVEFAGLLADLDTIVAAEHVGAFERAIASDIATKIRSGEREDGLSDHVTERGFCERWCIAGALVVARAGVARHVCAGAGDRITVRASLVRVTHFDSAYGRTHIAMFRTADGSSLVWRSSTGVMREPAAGRPQFDFVRPGECVEIVATVKEHGEYRGEAQTTITRAKLYLPGTAPVGRARGRKAA